MAEQISISNVVSVSVSAAPAGLGPFNTGNLLLISDETPDPVFDDDYKVYKSPTIVGEDFGTSSKTYKMAQKAFGQTPNLLSPGGSLIVAPLGASETSAEAVERLKSQVPFFGAMSTFIETEQGTEDFADVIQVENKLGFVTQRLSAEIDPGGILDLLRTGSYTKTRGLYYGGATDISALEFMAGYASRLFGVIFSGSNTTLNMHLKDIAGVQADPSMTQTLLDKAVAAGADSYPSIEGLSKVFTSGLNGGFVDQVQNLGWFVAAIQIAVFNYLAQTSTKIPQTEAGMLGMKNAIRQVCKQAVTNGYVAPGVWNSPDTFGNPEDLVANVASFGFYIYTSPIAEQLQADREARIAPLCQIAIKEAGAINKASVVIYVNP